MILPLTPDEARVVDVHDVAKGLDSGSMTEHSVRMMAAHESNVEGFVWACVLAIRSVSLGL
jgi:hypothetical protein